MTFLLNIKWDFLIDIIPSIEIKMSLGVLIAVLSIAREACVLFIDN